MAFGSILGVSRRGKPCLVPRRRLWTLSRRRRRSAGAFFFGGWGAGMAYALADDDPTSAPARIEKVEYLGTVEVEDEDIT